MARTHTKSGNASSIVGPILICRLHSTSRVHMKARRASSRKLQVLVNSMVVVRKPNGDLCVCLDPRDLNKAIKRPYYPVPTLNDVTSELAGAKHFSVLDARSGYWQIKLSDTSSSLTTFNTPFGRFRYLRMPFGVNSTQDVFQRPC